MNGSRFWRRLVRAKQLVISTITRIIPEVRADSPLVLHPECSMYGIYIYFLHLPTQKIIQTYPHVGKKHMPYGPYMTHFGTCSRPWKMWMSSWMSHLRQWRCTRATPGQRCCWICRAVLGEYVIHGEGQTYFFLWRWILNRQSWCWWNLSGSLKLTCNRSIRYFNMF